LRKMEKTRRGPTKAFEETGSYHPLARGANEQSGFRGGWKGERKSRAYDGRPNRTGRDWTRADAAEDFEEEAPVPASKKVITTNRGDVKNCTVEISNLVDGLEESDLLEIFDSVKDKVKKATVNSDGTAKLVFSTRSLAVDAMKEYDRAKVDGRPMFLRLLGEDATAAHVNKFVVEKSDGPSRTGPQVVRDFRAQEEDAGPWRTSRATDWQASARREPEGESKDAIFGSALTDEEMPARHARRSFGRGRADGPGRGAGRGGGRGGRGAKEKLVSTVANLDADLDAYRLSRKST